jgi:hypothetical protein
MDYGEAIQVLERANEKFEFPVKWGIDLQSEHERYLTEKHAKKPGLTLRRRGPRFRGQGATAMSSQSEVIETTVSKVAAELVRRGLDPDDRVTITIEPDELIPGRREARARVVAAGLTDEDIDRLINEAREEAQPLLG